MAAIERQAQGKTSLGVAKILAQDPYERPDDVKRSPKPRFHAFDREVFEMMFRAWRAMVEAFYEAAEMLRAGVRNVMFPEGMFAPSLPFVRFGTANSGGSGGSEVRPSSGSSAGRMT